jgi:hypothetical protein
MLHSKEELSLFHKLLKFELVKSLVPGSRIGRGFADVGFEEYLVISDSKVISLNTLKTSEIPNERLSNFHFPIYSVDKISELIYQLGWDIKNCSFVDQREWFVEIVNKNKQFSFSNKSLLMTFLNLYVKVLEDNV